MKVTDALLGEHGVVYAQFDYLEKNIPHAEDLTLVKSPGAMLTAALAPHAHLEDELLFIALAAHIDPQFGPLAVMRAEHDEIEGNLQRLQERTISRKQKICCCMPFKPRGHILRRKSKSYL